MNCKAMIPLMSLAGAASFAAAQSTTPDTSITFTLHWSEHNGNNNGVVEPGESVLFSLDVAFTNQNGIASFTPPIGTFGSGTIRGFGGGWIDLHGTGGAQGSWDVDPSNGHGVNSNWRISHGIDGHPANGGADLLDVSFGQVAAMPSAINTINPIPTIWTGLWTPDSYTPRTVVFAPAGGATVEPWVASVVLRLSTSGAANIFVGPDHLVLNAAAIPIVPAPQSLGGAAMAMLLSRRRRLIQ